VERAAAARPPLVSVAAVAGDGGGPATRACRWRCCRQEAGWQRAAVKGGGESTGWGRRAARVRAGIGAAAVFAAERLVRRHGDAAAARLQVAVTAAAADPDC